MSDGPSDISLAVTVNRLTSFGGETQQDIPKSEKKGKRKYRRLESYAADSQQTFNHDIAENSDHGTFVVAGRTGQARRVGGNLGSDKVDTYVR